MGGFGLNYAGNANDPILSPHPPNGYGVGPIYSNYAVTQMMPTTSYNVTDRLSIGFAPILDMSLLQVNPGVFAPTDDGVYPPATDSRYTFGGGFQVGAYWQGPAGWNVGASFRSPQWFEDFRYHTANPAGDAETAKFNLNVPMIVSLGTSYTGFERAVIGVDLHYIDYSDTAGYSTTGFGPGGAITGLGWRSIFCVAVGGQYWLTDKLAAQLGYSYHNNPIPDANTFFNIASPLNIQHIASIGMSYKLTEKLKLSVAYVHMFEATNTGPIYAATGPIAGSSVSSTASADSIIFGATVAW